MGRGMGAAEHDENSRVAAQDDPMHVLDKKRVMEDSDDEEEAAAMPEKAIEQIKQEQEVAWRQFHYPEWISTTKMIYVVFTFALISQIFTLTHYHGTHSWRRPVDLLPANMRMGGWEDNSFRYAGAVLGLISACFSFVLSPSTSKFKWMFFIMFLSAIFHSISFGKDVDALQEAIKIPICYDGEVGAVVPDMQTRRFGCMFARFRATVIFDVLCAFAGFAMGFFILYQAVTGIVSKRKVFNDQTKSWEKIVLGPEEEYHVAFPPTFKKQRPRFNFFIVTTAVLNVCSITLTATQMTLDLYQAEGQDTPIYNTGKNVPVDVYIYEGSEGIPFGLGTGSWPATNFYVRLAVNMVVLVATAFLIQWRRDGRVMQLYVIGAYILGGIGYVCATALDYDTYSEASKYCDVAPAHNMKCDQQPYLVVLVIDYMMVVFTFVFGYSSLSAWFTQAANSRAPYEGAPAGWFCFGGDNSEWAVQKRQDAEN